LPFLPARATWILGAAGLLVACRGPVSRARESAPYPTARPSPVTVRPPSEPGATSGPLDLGAALRLVQERNPDLAAAAAQVEAAAAGLRAAGAALRPRLSVDVGWLRSDAPSAALFKSIDAHVFAPTTDFNDPGWITNTEVGATLTQNLFDGGRDRALRRAAATGLEARRAQLDAVRNGLAAAAVAAWLEVHAARELAAADDASVRTVEAQVGELRTRVEGGAALRSDLLSLEVRLAEARERRLRTGLGERLALAALRGLLAWDPGQPLELAERGTEDLAGAVPASLEDARALALEQRPELAATRQAVAGARATLEAAGRSRLPRLDLLARAWGAEDDTSLDLNESNATLMLTLGFDLVDGGARRAGVAAARAHLREALARDRRAWLDVALDVETSWVRLEEARARLDVARQSIGASEETLALVERQFQGGSATVTRYLEAEAARTQVRTAEIRARLDLDRARIDLDRSMGRLTRPEALPGDSR
jgi:outer membrane protein